MNCMLTFKLSVFFSSLLSFREFFLLWILKHDPDLDLGLGLNPDLNTLKQTIFDTFFSLYKSNQINHSIMQ